LERVLRVSAILTGAVPFRSDKKSAQKIRKVKGGIEASLFGDLMRQTLEKLGKRSGKK